jgi:hypothetical protein
MAITTTTGDAQSTRAPGDIRTLLSSWKQSLAARRVSPATLATYTSAVEHLADHLDAQGMSTDVATIRREHVESFIVALLETRAPATAHNRRRACAGPRRRSCASATSSLPAPRPR